MKASQSNAALYSRQRTGHRATPPLVTSLPPPPAQVKTEPLRASDRTEHSTASTSEFRPGSVHSRPQPLNPRPSHPRETPSNLAPTRAGETGDIRVESETWGGMEDCELFCHTGNQPLSSRVTPATCEVCVESVTFSDARCRNRKERPRFLVRPRLPGSYSLPPASDALMCATCEICVESVTPGCVSDRNRNKHPRDALEPRCHRPPDPAVLRMWDIYVESVTLGDGRGRDFNTGPRHTFGPQLSTPIPYALYPIPCRPRLDAKAKRPHNAFDPLGGEASSQRRALFPGRMR